jgi:hypothetical protein
MTTFFNLTVREKVLNVGYMPKDIWLSGGGKKIAALFYSTT